MGLRSNRSNRRQSAIKQSLRKEHPSDTKLFSQENPNLYFHKSPAKGKIMPDLSGKHGLADSAYSRHPNPLSPDTHEVDEFVKQRKNV